MSRFPKNAEVVAALRDHGVPVQLVKGWDTAGVAWKHTGGLEGIIAHHTGTKSAVGPVGHPTLGYVANHFSRPAANMLVGRSKPEVYLLAAGATFHCGEGGPAFHNKKGEAIVPAGNQWQRIFGVEIDAHPANKDYITDAQVENMARIAAAILDLTGHGAERLMTHACWTNGCHGVNLHRANATFGRKADTREGAAMWPGYAAPHDHNAPFWRNKAVAYLKGPA